MNIRPALPADYPAFVQLFPELQVDDPIPSQQIWTEQLAPLSWVAEEPGQGVLGYCYCQQYTAEAYVRNIVVSPSSRGQGIGKALMVAAREHLRGLGKTGWRLNVKPDNTPAVALYRSMGMTEAYASVSVKLPWASFERLPTGSVNTDVLAASQDSQMEQRFRIPQGQLAAARAQGRLLLAAHAPDGSIAGLAVHSPEFPGSFPFRIGPLAAVRALLERIRNETHPPESHIYLVGEDDERLVQLLLSLGAQVRDRILHMTGPL